MTPVRPAKPLKDAVNDAVGAFTDLFHALKAKTPEVAAKVLSDVEGTVRRAREEVEALRRRAKSGGKRVSSAAKDTGDDVRTRLRRAWDELSGRAKPPRRPASSKTPR